MLSIAVKLPPSLGGSKLLKKVGDSVSFGEPFALLTSPDAAHPPQQLLSPLVGHLSSLSPLARAGEDFATFTGRKPLIAFRHGKSSSPASSSSSSVSVPVAVAAKSPPQEFPPSFGRLPPMLTPKESSLLHSGLAATADFEF